MCFNCNYLFLRNFARKHMAATVFRQFPGQTTRGLRKEGGRHLRLRGIGRHDGAEGGPVEGAISVQRGHAYCEVSGAKADRWTFKLQLVNQLVYCPQGSDVERSRYQSKNSRTWFRRRFS